MFNALQYKEELERAGFTAKQAEVSVRVLIDVMNDNFATKSNMNELRAATKSDLNELQAATKSDFNELQAATKSDFNELRPATKSDFNELRATAKSDLSELRMEMNSKFIFFGQEMRAGFKESEYRMTIKMGAMMVVTISTLGTLFKFLQVH